jgi:hypothetical protein
VGSAARVEERHSNENIKHQIPNTKKAQVSNLKKGRGDSGHLELGVWTFFGVWCLDCGVLKYAQRQI